MSLIHRAPRTWDMGADYADLTWRAMCLFAWVRDHLRGDVA